jgi:hypothetical protein
MMKGWKNDERNDEMMCGQMKKNENMTFRVYVTIVEKFISHQYLTQK